MPPAAGIRARNRAALEAEIQAVAGRHLAAYGAAALSLRAIAREMGMASSAIYRYVESRDELLTRLIIAAYDGLADAVEADLADAGDVPPMERFRIVSRGIRRWAVEHPHEFALIYGSPVPGYHAPVERTQEAGTRIPRLLMATLAGREQTSSPTEEAALGQMAAHPIVAPYGIDPATLHRGLAAWTLVLGAVTAELFEQLGRDAISDHELFFELILDDAERLVVG